MGLNHYHSKYIAAIHEGFLNSVMSISSKEVENQDFFNEIGLTLKKLKKNERKIYFFGNGASAAFANHMALDFSENGGILSKSLSDSAMLTALSNDYSYEKAMLEYLKIEGVSKYDLVITISSSGNSPNILNVLRHCKGNKIKTLALSGLKVDNNSVFLSDYSIYVPMKTYGMVECIHQIFLHLILDEFMEIYEWDRSDVQNMNASNFKL